MSANSDEKILKRKRGGKIEESEYSSTVKKVKIKSKEEIWVSFLDEASEKRLPEKNVLRGIKEYLEEDRDLLTKKLEKVFIQGIAPLYSNRMLNYVKGVTLLHWAVYNGYREILAELLRRDRSPQFLNQTDSTGRTALHLAAERGELDMVKLLVEYGADPSVSSFWHPHNCLYEAVIRGHIGVVQYLVNEKPGLISYLDRNTPNYLLLVINPKIEPKACIETQDSRLKIAQFLHEKEARFVENLDQDGNTALHLALACQPPHKKMVKWLLEKMPIGRIGLRNRHNQNAFLYALTTTQQVFSTELLNLLYDKKRELFEDSTILHLVAQRKGSSEMLLWLEEHCRDKMANWVNRLDKNGHSPLYYMLQQQPYQKDIIARFWPYLLTPIADPSLLSAACAVEDSNKASTLVQFLLEQGAGSFINHKEGFGDMTALHSAIKKGHLDICSLLLNGGAELGPALIGLYNSKNEEKIVEKVIKPFCKDNLANFTPAEKKAIMSSLFRLAANTRAGKYLDLIGELLGEKSLPSDITNMSINMFENKTFLEDSIEKDDIGMVSRLLELGASLDSCASAIIPRPPLNLALSYRGGRKAIAKLLLSLPNVTSYINNPDYEQHTPLHLAVKSGDIDMVSTLLKKGASTDSVDKVGNTPLHWAVGQNKIEIVKLLLEYNASAHKRNKEGLTPLDIAVRDNKEEIAKLLLQQEATSTTPNMSVSLMESLAHASGQGNKKMVALLLNSGVKIHSQYVHTAVCSGNKAMVEFWLNPPYNLPVDHCFPKFGTPLHVAASKGNLEVVKLLLQRGANINTANSAGNTPLHLAVLNGHKEIVEFLVEEKADINKMNNNGQTVLHCAVARVDIKGITEIVEFLLHRGAAVDLPDNDGDTPLYCMLLSSFWPHRLMDQSLPVENTCKLALLLVNRSANMHFAEPRQPLLHILLNLVKAQGLYSILDDFRKQLCNPLLSDLLQNLCQRDPRLIEEGDQQGRLPLHIAVEMGLEDMVDLFCLCQGKSLIDAQDNLGETPLHKTAHLVFVNVNMATKLIEQYRARLDIPDKEGRTPLDLSQQKDECVRDKKLIAYLQERSAPKRSMEDLISRCSVQRKDSDSAPMDMDIIEEEDSVSITTNPYRFQSSTGQGSLSEESEQKKSGFNLN